MEQLKKTLRDLMAIDSTTGFFVEMDEYLLAEAKRMGIPAVQLNKGGVRFDLGGEGNPVTIASHVDAIGLMVRQINADGTLSVIKVGGVHPYYALDWNCRVHARNGKVYTGTVRRKNPSVHLMSQSEKDTPMDLDTNLVLLLDEDVYSRADVEKLGITCGDQVAIETRYQETEKGFIKSRYLDDKASAATLLALAQRVADGRVKLNRKVSLLFTEYEEIGHGGACGIPADTRDLIAVDIGCMGLDHDSSEHKVTITTKDTSFPYHTVLTDELVKLCEKNGIPYALDMMVPSYGSDADVSLRAGYDVRHALIGPGVRETHGYERTHEDALDATLRLITAVVEA